jgi:hypothetical protein
MKLSFWHVLRGEKAAIEGKRSACRCGGLAGPTGQSLPQMSEARFALLRKCEGCVLHAYDDANRRPINPEITSTARLQRPWPHRL